MKQEVQIKQEWNPQVVMEDLQNTQKMCQALMQTPHYKKMGAEGIFAIVQKAKAMNLNPLDALNGGMYCVNGKVEMSAIMMLTLIRRQHHSVTKDKRSDDSVCILHGKRKDNGDTWTESFSINDAKRAGIYKNTWEKFPRNMLFARALSNLARQLFPDVIGGCYVEGEISQAPPITDWAEIKQPENIVVTQDHCCDYDVILPQEHEKLEKSLESHSDIRESLIKWLKNNKNTEDLSKLPAEIYPKMMARIEKATEEIRVNSPSLASEVPSEYPEFNTSGVAYQVGEELQLAMGG